MPELPEVELAARNLRRWTKGRRITAVHAATAARRIFRPAQARALNVLKGARFRQVARIGKHLLVTLDGPAAPIGIWSHLGMTGKWLRRAGDDAVPGATRVQLDLDDGSRLHYVDSRMFGRFRLVPRARFDDVAELKALGPDPLTDGIDVARLHTALQATALPVKVALLDQTRLAGVGNIQASEALHRAALDPRRAGRSLSRAEVGRLARAILKSIDYTLSTFVAAGADRDTSDVAYVEEPGTANPFLVYGRAGDPCRRCGKKRGGVIQRIVQAQRATFFCPLCQG
ncbi:MAG TPA: DNA-formamidopyrimidine glycosylase family protein [Polyangia bacterium]|jgi:formamidopyrimidine-DNA glycosylase|nr:DNA-formamidopyrimidine glycosylase family protein [Polyangia bacterium]